MFQGVVSALKERYMRELLTLQVGELTVPAVHAKVHALNDIEGEIRSFLNDETVALRRQK